MVKVLGVKLWDRCLRISSVVVIVVVGGFKTECVVGVIKIKIIVNLIEKSIFFNCYIQNYQKDILPVFTSMDNKVVVADTD